MIIRLGLVNGVPCFEDRLFTIHGPGLIWVLSMGLWEARLGIRDFKGIYSTTTSDVPDDACLKQAHEEYFRMLEAGEIEEQFVPAVFETSGWTWTCPCCGVTHHSEDLPKAKKVYCINCDRAFDWVSGKEEHV